MNSGNWNGAILGRILILSGPYEYVPQDIFIRRVKYERKERRKDKGGGK